MSSSKYQAIRKKANLKIMDKTEFDEHRKVISLVLLILLILMVVTPIITPLLAKTIFPNLASINPNEASKTTGEILTNLFMPIGFAVVILLQKNSKAGQIVVLTLALLFCVIPIRNISNAIKTGILKEQQSTKPISP